MAQRGPLTYKTLDIAGEWQMGIEFYGSDLSERLTECAIVKLLMRGACPSWWRLSQSTSVCSQKFSCVTKKAEAVKGELVWTSYASFLQHALVFSSSWFERRGRSNEIAKQDWKQRPECCYFWCWSRSGGKERRASHAAHDICCLLSPCPFAPEEVLLMFKIHHRWSEVADRPETLWHSSSNLRKDFC